MTGILFYVLLGFSVGLFAKVYHTQGLSDPVIVGGIMLCLCAIGFNASSLLIQRVGFLISLALFPSNILYSFAFKSQILNGLEPIGGTVCVISLLSLAIFRR